jgi:hypothetical protein
MGLMDGTMTKSYNLGEQIDRYSDLSDKLRAGSISAGERKELRTMRKHLAI